ncbi:MAG: bifunctional DNA-formamidopyrimidine glycosylase/DNA-(apurinic or apyrimidinic site) lyase [Candidatus Komeilibacteria bacterium]
MPELPEVETIRHDLRARILNKQIKKVVVRKSNMVAPSAAIFKRALLNKKIGDIDRIGKLMIFKLDDGNYILWHLKMTGQLIYQGKKGIVAGGHSVPTQSQSLPNQFSHVYIIFADNSVLYFNDMRQFGYAKLANQESVAQAKKKFGPEPLQSDFTWEYFKQALGKRKTSIKAVLLNQQLIAGIGNIYADEICFQAKVRPGNKVYRLSLAQKMALFQACNTIISKGIKYRGTTLADFVDADGKSGLMARHLKVFARQGKKCYRCGEVIKKIRVAGRGTHFCPNCQL